MANLPINTTYNKRDLSLATNFPNVYKKLQQNALKGAADTFQSSETKQFNPIMSRLTPRIVGSFAPVRAYQPDLSEGESNFVPGEPLASQLAGKYESLPDYAQFVKKADEPWVTDPTDQAKLRNWPLDLGGGQYVVDPSQAGDFIKSKRVIVNPASPGIRRKMLGNLPSGFFEIDHIIPLWAGGADSHANLEILDKVDHNKKKAIEAVSLTLFTLPEDDPRKISLNQAKLMLTTSSWKDKEKDSLDLLSKLNERNYVSPKVAEKYATKWEKDKTKSRTFEFFGRSFREEMSKFGEGWLPAPIREFAKGLVGGTGVVPGTEALPETGTEGKVANFAGNLVTMITGIGAVSKGLTAVGLFGKSAKAAQNAAKLGKIVDQSIKSSANIGKWTGVGTKMYQSSLALAVWGQMGLLTRQITGQEESDFRTNLKQATSDAIFGSILGSAAIYAKGGQSLSGYAHVGGGTMVWSTMQGASIEDAVKDGIVMTALHGMGYRKGMVDPRSRMLNDAVYKEAASKVRGATNGAFSAVPTKNSEIPRILKFDNTEIQNYDTMRINYKGFKDPRPITNTEEALRFLENVARKEMKVFDGKTSEETIVKELRGITTAFNQLRNQTLDPIARVEKTLKDQQSVAEKMRSQIITKDVRPLMSTASDGLKNLPIRIMSRDKVPASLKNQYKNEIFEEGLTTTRGIGRDEQGAALNQIARDNLNDFASGKKEHDGHLYISQNNQTVKIGELINQEALSKRESIPIENIENTLPTFMKDVKTGEFLETGYIPQPIGLRESNIYNINRPLTESIKRLKEKWMVSSDADTLMKSLNKDKAFKDSPIEITRARKLFNMKGQVEKMSNEQIIDTLDPPNRLDKYTIDNTTVAPMMKKLDVPVLIVDIKSTSPIGKGENINDPSVKVSITKNDFLRSVVSKSSIIYPTPIKPPVLAPVTPLGATLPLKTTKVSTIPKTSTKQVSKAIKALPKVGKSDLVNDYYNEIVDRIITVKPSGKGPQANERQLMDIIKNFKRKNPGLPEKEFKNIMKDTKLRASTYVRNFIDDIWRGTSTLDEPDIKYSRTNKRLSSEYTEFKFRYGMTDIEIKEMGIEKFISAKELTKRLNPNEKLAEEFGLKLQEPNEAGDRYLSVNEKGNPEFSEAYKKSYPDLKKITPLNYYGKFLTNELKALKAENSRLSREWKRDLDKMKESSSPYGKGFAQAMDTALGKKWDTKYDDWGTSWKANAALRSTSVNPLIRNSIKDLFAQTGIEGELISVPFRRVAARTIGKGDYQKIKQLVAKVDIKTKAVTFKAELERLERLGKAGRGFKEDIEKGVEREEIVVSDLKEKGFTGQDIRQIAGESRLGAEDLTKMRIKDPNQFQNVLEDLTPFELMMNGMRNTEARKTLVDRYNNIRKELGGASAESNTGVYTQMQMLFNQIKALSVNIPNEVKTWKLGERIILKNKGEPTFEQGMQDGFNVAAKMFQLKPSPGYIKYEDIKKSIIDSQ